MQGLGHHWRDDDKASRGSNAIVSQEASPSLATSSLSSSSSPSLAPLATNPPATPIPKPPFFPFRPLSNLQYLFVVLVMVPGGITFASMFVLSAITPVYFQKVYHLNSLEIGLTYLSGGVANILSSLTGGKILDCILMSTIGEGKKN